MSPAVAELLPLSPRALLEVLKQGHPIDPCALDDSEYRGISLGLPAILERLTWKVFKKAFHRDPHDATLRGWNLRLEQRGIDGPCVPLLRRGLPVTFGHFRVRPTDDDVPHHLVDRLLLDYSLGGSLRYNPIRNPTCVVRDVIVALQPGNFDRLFGWMYLDLGIARPHTPSFFLLQRHGALSHRVPPPRGGSTCGRP